VRDESSGIDSKKTLVCYYTDLVREFIEEWKLQYGEFTAKERDFIWMTDSTDWMSTEGFECNLPQESIVIVSCDGNVLEYVRPGETEERKVEADSDDEEDEFALEDEFVRELSFGFIQMGPYLWTKN